VERFRVSLPTVRQALSVLRAEGLIESRHGVGTFVKEQRRLQRRSRGRYGSA
jgi:DNA-binding GntR family transcriptional regulator